MIGYIKGKIVELNDESVLIETGGIGYELAISAAAYDLCSGKDEVALYAYMQVREDGVYLYGFASKAEKSMFLKLISVSGVGPKMGIGILSSINVNNLAVAIATADIKTLSKVKGLGKKTAERLVLELKEKVEAEEPIAAKTSKIQISSSSPQDEDAIVGLMSLGYNRATAVNAVERAKNMGAKSIEEIIMLALKTM